MDDQKKYGKTGEEMWEMLTYDGTKWFKMPGIFPDTEKKFQIRHEMECRESDVFLCSYPKSGTNWVHEIISMIISHSLEYNTYNTLDNLLDIQPDLEQINTMPSPRFLLTHLRYRDLPLQLRNGIGKIVHIQRNPKDWAVSRYHFLKGKLFDDDWSWDDAYEMFFFREDLQVRGGWFNFVKEYEKMSEQPNVLSLFYEELKADLKTNVIKIAKFLEKPCTQELAEEVAEKCGFQNMKKNRRDFTRHLTPGNKSTLYRKGDVGDWKNWFTVSQNERFNELYKKEMTDSQLQFIYEL